MTHMAKFCATHKLPQKLSIDKQQTTASQEGEGKTKAYKEARIATKRTPANQTASVGVVWRGKKQKKDCKTLISFTVSVGVWENIVESCVMLNITYMGKCDIKK